MAVRRGMKVGNIRVEQRIGEGGMGAVYSGFDEKLKRRVALKVVRPDRLDAGSKARFLREARVLSQLNHPRICHIFDYIKGDESDYLVLEFIDGVDLKQAFETGLDASSKMNIAEGVAEVLVAAHARGIVHRDLKPKNIMLDDSGGVKVLDFGLARSLSDTGPASDGPSDVESEHRLSVEDSAYVETGRGSVTGTVTYMSPEQANGESAAAASDMYSFGLLLQELFTGRPPYPPGLSKVALLFKAANAESAPVTGLSSDLTTLINRLKSLAPEDRPSAAETAERLQWIRNKPKRRIRWMLAALVMLVLGLASVKYTFDLRRERTAAVVARAEAEKVVEFMVDLFEVSDPSEDRANTVTAREILTKGAESIHEELQEQPLVQARLMETIGRVYLKLGLFSDSEALLEEALHRQEALYGADDIRIADSLHHLGRVLRYQGRYADAEPIYQRVLAIREAVLGPNHADVASCANSLAVLYWEQGKHAHALPLLERSLAIRETELGPDHPRVAMSLTNLAMLHEEQLEFDVAKPLYERALKIMEKSLGPDHPDIVISLNGLAVLYMNLGQYDDAEVLYRRAVTISEKAVGPEHPDVAFPVSNLGELYEKQGAYEEAEKYYQRALSIWERSLGPDHLYLAWPLHGLANVCRELRRFEDAEIFFKRALSIRRKALEPDDPELLSLEKDYAVFVEIRR